MRENGSEENEACANQSLKRLHWEKAQVVTKRRANEWRIGVQRARANRVGAAETGASHSRQGRKRGDLGRG